MVINTACENSGWRIKKLENEGKFNDDWNTVGGYLKSETTWTTSDSPVHDNYEFTALPGGRRDNSSNFNGITNYGMWWSATVNDSENSFVRTLSYTTMTFSRTYNRNDFGVSVRCVKDN